MIRSIALAVALVASAQAAPLKRAGGCPPHYYRGAGGTCLYPAPEPYYGAERPDGYYASGYYWPYRTNSHNRRTTIRHGRRLDLSLDCLGTAPMPLRHDVGIGLKLIDREA